MYVVSKEEKKIKSQPIPPTILDKWRSKGFELANLVDEKEEETFNAISEFQNQNSLKMQDIERIKANIIQGKTEIINLEDQLKSLESMNSVNAKHLSGFQEKNQKLDEIYSKIIGVSENHLKSLDDKFKSISESNCPISKIDDFLSKTRSFNIPKESLQYKVEEKKLKKLQSQYSQQQNQVKEHEAAQSIFEKLIVAYQKSHELEMKRKAIEDNQKAEQKERQKEEELKLAYKEIQEKGKKTIQEEEKKLKRAYEDLLNERNNISQQVNSIQIQLEKYSTLVQQTNDSMQEKINQYENTIQKQESEIQSLKEELAMLESLQRKSISVNTEKVEKKIPIDSQQSKFPTFDTHSIPSLLPEPYAPTPYQSDFITQSPAQPQRTKIFMELDELLKKAKAANAQIPK